MRSLSLRSRAALAAIPVLVIALGLVGLAVREANYQGAVSALQLRMESYVYSVLAAMEMSSSGELSVEEEMADPRLVQPASGLYIQVQGETELWVEAESKTPIGRSFTNAVPAALRFAELRCAGSTWCSAAGAGAGRYDRSGSLPGCG